MSDLHTKSFNLGIIMGAIVANQAYDEPRVCAHAISDTGADLESLIGIELSPGELKSLYDLLDEMAPPIRRIFVTSLDEDGNVRVDAIDAKEQAA
ncbi:hypothetical protein [Pacificibacter marinus]|uniref:hypothetical protein n=1 Tax=Pacificibacter marinus TaxID=658057 RepID=UPI001C069E9D|nr:hypothetical protein [Pacificibacter marinus]MBU2867043.1 hypothetical protein [Pacificibacter marinus]